MDNLISQGYRELNKKLHEDRLDYGTSGKKYAEDVLGLVLDGDSILDYGCGKQTLAEALPMAITGYDPCIPGLEKTPEPHDLVVCTDVMEHIEPDLLDNVLDDLQRVTKKTLYCLVATRPAVKTLADGRNAHLIVEPMEWWLPKFKARFKVVSTSEGKGAFTVICKRLT